jgi:hypothetical protein
MLNMYKEWANIINKLLNIRTASWVLVQVQSDDSYLWFLYIKIRRIQVCEVWPFNYIGSSNFGKQLQQIIPLR